MSKASELDAIVIDCDVEARMRLKQATSSVCAFRKVTQFSTLRDSLDKLPFLKTDVVFISYRFPRNEVSDFVLMAKRERGSRDAAYVLVLSSKDQDSSTIASNVILGADGFLFEPYSVESLVEITDLAARVRGERIAERQQAAFGLMLTEIMNQIDLYAHLKRSGQEPGSTLRQLRELCAPLPKFDEATLQNFHKIAIDTFEQAPAPKNVYQRRSYSGASARIKKKMEEMLLAEIGQVPNKEGETKK